MQLRLRTWRPLMIAMLIAFCGVGLDAPQRGRAQEASPESSDPAAVAAMEKAYRVYSKKVPLDAGGYTMDHTALVYLMDKEGRFVAPFNLKRKPEDAAAELKRYL